MSRLVSAPLTAEDLSLAQYDLLRSLAGSSGRTLETREVARGMMAHAPNITRLVDRLEARGLLRRKRCSEDRRVVWVSLTEEGSQLVDRLTGAVEGAAAGALAGLDSSDRRELGTLLERLRTSPDASHQSDGRSERDEIAPPKSKNQEENARS